MSKPANYALAETRHPSAYYSDLCNALGINVPPRSANTAVLLGRSVLLTWSKFPRTLRQASQSLTSMTSALMALSADSSEFTLARQLVLSMMNDVPENLAMSETYDEIIISLRCCLTRTPEEHFALACNELGLAGAPNTVKEARSSGAHVINGLKNLPGHSQHLKGRLPCITASLRSLPNDSHEFRMATSLVSRITNPKRVPKVVRDDKGFQLVATRLRRAMMRTIPQGS